VLDHSLGAQRLVQVVGVRPGHCFENCICTPGQPDAHGAPVDASGQATEKSDLCPDHTGYVVQDLGRRLFGMGALGHRFLAATAGAQHMLNTLGPNAALAGSRRRAAS
jgi:hypothetical protein